MSCGVIKRGKASNSGCWLPILKLSKHLASRTLSWAGPKRIEKTRKARVSIPATFLVFLFLSQFVSILGIC